MTMRSSLVSRLLANGGVPLALFTVVTNLLLLVPPVYMLQVYDRVLASGSVDTLLYITLIAVLSLVVLTVFDGLRALIAGRAGARLTVDLAPAAFGASLSRNDRKHDALQPLADLATVSSFVGGRHLISILDLPFAPIFLALTFLLHPALFWLTSGGVALLALIAILNERATKGLVTRQHQARSAAGQSALHFARSKDTLRALGMSGDALRSWGKEEARSLRAQAALERIEARYSGVSRGVRLLLQVGIIGLGGYLALVGQISGGMIFAASLLSGRALMPIDALIGNWKQVLLARAAWHRLVDAMAEVEDTPRRLDLPEIGGRLEVENLVAGVPGVEIGAAPAILRRVSFSVEAGERVAVVGPSGAGKSTLARSLVGIVRPWAGCVRLGGNDLANYDETALGRRIGYLSQDIDLLPGTIAENISRFRAGTDAAAIVEAARRAHVHDVILRLPDGYDTRIDSGARQLSGGQRQRIALARAFFGRPVLLVLDEPNAHLDAEGEEALENALVAARSEGVTTVVVTQRRSLAENADKVLILRDGSVEAFGTPDMLTGLSRVPPPQEASSSGQVVAHPRTQEREGEPAERPEVLLARDRAERALRKELTHAR